VAEVCSIYLKRDETTLELCATEGLRPTAVHSVRLRVGHGLVGRIAERAEPLATDDAPSTPGFRYLPETGEERYRSFVGVPVQRLGEVMGVLVVQNEAPRIYEDDDIEALEIVAMVIAEMAESGAFLGSAGLAAGPGRRRGPVRIQGAGASDGTAIGPVHLHEPRMVSVNPIAEDPATERLRLSAAMEALRGDADQLIARVEDARGDEPRDIFEAYRMVAYDKGWSRRLLEAIDSGLSAEVAVEKVQSDIRSRMERVADPYLRERLHDLDDVANRLLRHLVSPDDDGRTEIPRGAVLVARNLGPGALMDHAHRISAVVLEEGSLSSHSAIVARALDIPMIVQADRITRDANPGDQIVVDGETGRVELRPGTAILEHYRGRIAHAAEAQAVYRGLVGRPATTRDGTAVALKMNAGVLADLPSLAKSGAEGVGLYRTELQFMIRERMPGRSAQADLYSRILDAAAGSEVCFRTLDIGSDKVLPYMPRRREVNPALGWRAIRVGLDRPLLFRMQIQGLIRGAKGRPLSIMFPLVSEAAEFFEARAMVEAEIERLARHGHERPRSLKVGLMFEVPSLVHAPERLFREADFVSVGGNDLLQFYYAADRENERVRRRYDTLNLSFLDFLRQIVERCERLGTKLCFCGEAAGRPVDALALAAIGFRELSMRSASIGPVKQALINADLCEVRAAIEQARSEGETCARAALLRLSEQSPALV
ncbi:MAG TPA: phosphoenolpyruvate--protein phosphotransferase, partial [Paracoccaceae bacterium]|nr:phosphoenolpyruvate--protein phosphotransferase [Paracoccaceae bacterium]